MKYINFKTIKFSKMLEKIDVIRHDFIRFLHRFNFKTYNLKKYYKNFYYKKYSFYKIINKFNFKKYKNVPLYFIGTIVLLTIFYLSSPLFYTFNKKNITEKICGDLELKCVINDQIKYSIFPTPRLKIKNLKIYDYANKKKVLADVRNLEIKFFINGLLKEKKLSFNKLILRNAVIDINLENFNKYNSYFKKEINFPEFKMKKTYINFLDNEKTIATINNANLSYKVSKKFDETVLKGKILNDEIYINFKNKKKDKKISKILIVKLLNSNFLAKINLFNISTEKGGISGKAIVKQEKNRIDMLFNYKNGKIGIKQSNLKNPFLDGKFSGEIEFLPFFNFNLDLELNGLNFNRLRTIIVNLDKSNRDKLFELNKKINGKLNLSSDKIYSKYNLVNSFESRLNFINGNILVEQLLFNLGKLGAADITGVIKNTDNRSNFKFEKNIFVDNEKYFFNKFGVFNRENKASSLYISGSFDFKKLHMRLNEISSDKKFHDNETNYIETEFNNILLEDDYNSLFNFLLLKKFIKKTFNELN